jgi:transmembrane sensor
MLRSADIIDGEAADWLTKLDCGELTKKDRIALKKWLAQDPCHGVALNNMAAMWRDMDFLLNDVSLEEPEPLRIMERLSLARGAAAFAVCLMCTLGLILWSGFTIPTEQAVYTTAIGKQHLQELNDGSSALLNTNSVIETDFTRDSRIVRLMQGEALFDVAHDPSRPFIVYVGDRAVKAIGTTFVVRIESENIHVSVTDGQVQLSKREVVTHDWSPPKSQEVILVSKGEWVETNSTTAIPEAQTIENEEFNRRLSWSQGRLVFDNERLELVIKEVSRYVPNKIIIEDPELRDVRFSGRFTLGDTDALLEAIEVTLHVQTTHIKDQEIRLSR